MVSIDDILKLYGLTRGAIEVWRSKRLARTSLDAVQLAKQERLFATPRIIADCLAAFYGNPPMTLGLRPVQVSAGSMTVSLPLCTSSDRMGLRQPLASHPFIYDGESSDPLVPFRFDESVFQLLRLIEARSHRNPWEWDTPTFRLTSDDGYGNLTFGTTMFRRARFIDGLIQDELIWALIETKGNVALLTSEREQYLPLRMRLLPDFAALVNLKDRLCIGGPVVMFAMRADDHFIIPYVKRSDHTCDSRGLLSLIPQGFHQWHVRPQDEVSLFHTVVRETYEELFGGKDVEERKTPRLLQGNWTDHSGIAPLIDERVAVDLLGYNYSLLTGNCDFLVIAIAEDDNYLSAHKELLKKCWEHSEIESFRTTELTAIAEIVRNPHWAPEGLLTLVAGLQELKRRHPESVALDGLSWDLVYDFT